MERNNIYEWLLASSAQYDGWLYIGDNEVRYALGQPGKRNLVVIGINPSSATPEKPDATIRKVCSVAERDEAIDGWIMLNLYPLRNKDPKAMPEMSDKKLSDNNIAVIGEVFKRFDIWKLWAAWGDAIDTRDYYADELRKIVAASNCEWFCRGSMTRSGNPRHPLYLPGDAEFDWFPVMDYLSYFDTAELY